MTQNHKIVGTLIYLHGFLSSNQSAKALQTHDYFKQHYPNIKLVTPQLPNHPDAVKVLLNKLIAQYKTTLIGFIGSSLGGYFATWCSAQTQRPAVLINPAIYPYLLLEQYLGEHINPYTQEKITVTPAFNQSLKQFAIKDTQLLTLFVLVQTGDETLDYREAVGKFTPDQIQIIKGGDHAFQHYRDYLPKISEFLRLNGN